MAGNFSLAADGHGGTLVTDPPLAPRLDPASAFLASHRQ
jgi:hypothetical protein